jgi:hypothetical protein
MRVNGLFYTEYKRLNAEVLLASMSAVDQDAHSVQTCLMLHEQRFFFLTSAHTCLLHYLRNTIQNKHHGVPSSSVTSQLFVCEISKYYANYTHGFHKFQSPALGSYPRAPAGPQTSNGDVLS